MPGYVYIMTNKPWGTLYLGVTGHLARRVHQHREGTGFSFCREHGLTRLVWAEPYTRMLDAIARGKAMKAWRRRWKTKRIEAANPEWRDLWDDINA